MLLNPCWTTPRGPRLWKKSSLHTKPGEYAIQQNDAIAAIASNQRPIRVHCNLRFQLCFQSSHVFHASVTRLPWLSVLSVLSLHGPSPNHRGPPEEACGWRSWWFSLLTIFVFMILHWTSIYAWIYVISIHLHSQVRTHPTPWNLHLHQTRRRTAQKRQQKNVAKRGCLWCLDFLNLELLPNQQIWSLQQSACCMIIYTN